MLHLYVIQRTQLSKNISMKSEIMNEYITASPIIVYANKEYSHVATIEYINTVGVTRTHSTPTLLHLAPLSPSLPRYTYTNTGTVTGRGGGQGIQTYYNITLHYHV